MEKKNCNKIWLSSGIPTQLEKDIRDNFEPLCNAAFSFAYKDADKLTASEKNDKIKIIITNLQGIINLLMRAIESK